ncbi:cache domain-containing protein, partial [Campylobacter sp. RM16191]|uniref:methyl-accepting chemotaxis protein n=2 Tax=unclassified Campylobacter TaxID=2593542 RepID=UPI0032D5AA93
MFRKISSKIALFIFVLLSIAFTIMAVINYNKTKNSVLDVTEISKESTTLASGIFVDEYMSSRIKAVEDAVSYLEKNQELFLGDREALQKDLANITNFMNLEEFFIGFANDGEMISISFANDRRDPKISVFNSQNKQYDARTRGWYKTAVAKGGLAFTAPYVTKSKGLLVMSVIKPVMIEGKVAAVLGIDMLIDELGKSLSKIKDSPSGIVFIIDMNTKSMVYHPDRKMVVEKDETALRVAQDFIGYYEKYKDKTFAYEMNGDNKVASCSAYDTINWLVCSANLVSDYDLALNSILFDQILISVISTIAIVIILMVIIGYFLKPLNFISTGLVSFFKFLNYEIKEPAKLDVRTKDEFGVMASLINENISKIQSAKISEDEFIRKANVFVDNIESGKFTATLDADVQNPALMNLKEAFAKLSLSLQTGVATNSNIIFDTLNRFKSQDFSARTNDKGLVASGIDLLGQEVSGMLRQSLEQAKILEEKAEALKGLMKQLTDGTNIQANSLQESAA